jgi:hypothetical protein
MTSNSPYKLATTLLMLPLAAIAQNADRKFDSATRNENSSKSAPATAAI